MLKRYLWKKQDKILVDKNCETHTVDHIQLTASRLSMQTNNNKHSK